MAVKKGDTIRVEYVGTLSDGTEFDSSKKHDKPLEFQVGSGMVIKGFDDGVIGMEIDEEKEINILCDSAYGKRNPDLVKKVPRDKMPEGDIQEGMMVGLQTPEGQQIPATITEVTDSEITIDINHPLCDQDLTFNVKLLEVVSSAE
jgi:FKBP-type peptidyl-prolyl cis-trans isomerase 2